MSTQAIIFERPTSGAANPVLRLRTFGGLHIERVAELIDPSVGQRRKLAVMALLAASGDGVSRERLVGLLWSECDEERARHTFAQLLHALRRAAGADVTSGSPTSLRLNPDVVTSDVADFESAIARQNYLEAVRLYRGAFLDGFYLNGCPEFERWVEEHRAALGRKAERAIEALATRAGAAGDARQAAEWWLHLSLLRPLDSRITLELMQATVAAGDHATALGYARAHEKLLLSELDAAPPPALTAYAASLRAASWSAHAGATDRARLRVL
jgi:DNA-binding SARP family transcriptional activator